MSIIKDFFQGLSKSVTCEVKDSIHDEIDKYINDAIEKSIKKMFVVGTAISIIAVGSFLFLWGIASGIDKIFNMGGVGYMIFGIFGILVGMLVRYNWLEELRR